MVMCSIVRRIRCAQHNDVIYLVLMSSLLGYFCSQNIFNVRFFTLGLLLHMSSKKRVNISTISNEIPDPTNLEGGDDDTELSEGSKEPDSKSLPLLSEVMISCIQTTLGDYSLVSLWLIL